MKNKLKAIWRILRAKEWVCMTYNGHGYSNFHQLMPLPAKEAPAHEFVDWMFDRVNYLTAGMKVTASKIYDSYHLKHLVP